MNKVMYDVVIAGGGLVGASLAVALAPTGLRVALVEAAALRSTSAAPTYDERSVALAHGSQLIYQTLGLWPQLQAEAEPIRSIHISDKGFFGVSRLHATQEKVPALGYVLENRVLGQVLYAALQRSEISLLAPARVTRITPAADGNSARLSLDKTGAETLLDCRLLVVADGADSALRQQLGIATEERDYQQSAVIANVSTAKPHQNIAYERFTRSGPLALLPLSRGRYSLVWTRRADEVAATLQADDTAFLQQLQQAFGYRQGAFIKTGKRSAYPLRLVKSAVESAGRALVIGNASHALHPVAGQGLNLALRDVAVLTRLLREAANTQSDVGASALLAEYTRLRTPDYQRVVRYTDGLVRVFSSDLPGLGPVRAGALFALERLSPLRRRLARQSMGLHYMR